MKQFPLLGICLLFAISLSAQPTISTISSSSGIPGSTITLTGTNFNTTAANNIVFFGATKGTVSGASATTLSVTIPSGAIFNRVSVTNTGTSLMVQQQYPFLPTFNGNQYVSGSAALGTASTINPSTPGDLAVGDIDGDGKPDMVTVYYNYGYLYVYKNASTAGTLTGGSFSAIFAGSTYTQTNGVAIGDLDRDGKPEVVVTCNNGGNGFVSVFHNASSSGSVAFDARYDYYVGTSIGAPAIGDLDGDGRADIALGYAFANTVAVFRNAGGALSGSTFPSHTDFTVNYYPRSLAICDLDGDGKADIATGNYGPASVSVLRNTSTAGSLAFASYVDFATGVNPTVAVADVDGDALPDLITANYGSNTLSVLRNTGFSGTLSFATKVDFTALSAPKGISVGDINGDGKADIFVSHGGTTYLSVFRNTATSGSITSGSLSRADYNDACYASNAVAADLDGDGLTDAAVADLNNNIISVMRNVATPIVAVTSVSAPNAIPGNAVTITGTGFNTTAASNIVSFGGARATVVSSSATTLSVTMPAGANVGRLSVTNTGTSLMGQQKYPFLPTFNGSIYVSSTLGLGSAATVNPTSPSDLATSDIDGDGKTDIVTAFYNFGYLYVYKNISTSGTLTGGSFSALYVGNTLGQPTGIAIGDLDRDGKPEIAVTCNNSGNGYVSVFHNASTSGSVSFDNRYDYYVGASISAPAIGDIDGDGKADIALCYSSASAVAIFRNAGGTLSAGTFPSHTDFTTNAYPRSIAICDLDGDGKADIATGNYGVSSVSVLRNTSVQGTVSFSTYVDFATGSNPSLTVMDVDGDALPDLVTANYGSNTLSVLRNTATSGIINSSSFAAKVDFTSLAGPKGISVGDINGDGKADIFVSNLGTNYLSVFRNTATSGTITTGSLSRVDYADGCYAAVATVADFDGDGLADVAVADQSNNVMSLLRNTATPLVSVTAVSASSAIAGTNVTITGTGFNATAGSNIVSFGGAKATVVSSSATTLSVTMPSGGTFSRLSVTNTGTSYMAQQKYPFLPTFNSFLYVPNSNALSVVSGISAGTPSDLVAGDIDGDGKTDLVTAYYSYGNIYLFRNNNTAGSLSGSSFISVFVGYSYSQPNGVALGDLDCDGKPEIIITSNNGGNGYMSVYHNASTTGSPYFDNRYDYYVGTSIGAPAVGDIDGDGKADIAITYTSGNGIAIFRNAGGALSGGTFATHSDFTTNTAPRSIAICDLDGDGKADIATGNYGSSSVSVLRNTSVAGSVSFAAYVDFAAGNSPNVAVADIDGDALPDLLTTNYGSNTLSVLRNTATSGTINSSSFAAKVDFATLGGPKGLSIGDINGDGKADIYISTLSNPYVSVLRNTATSGSITSGSLTRSDYYVGYYGNAAAVADFDGDGLADAAVADQNNNAIGLLRNAATSMLNITAVSPNQASPGATVTITGTSFNTTAANNTVYFGATKAVVASASATTLSVTVPVDATFGRLSVLNTGTQLQAYQQYSFLPTFDTSGFSLQPSFSPRVSLSVSNYPVGVAFGDIDGDGKPEMVMANNGANAILVYQNISSSGSISAASFGTPISFGTTNYPQTVRLVDIDNDGKLDIVTDCAANDAANAKIAIFRNTATLGSITSGSFATRVDATAGLSINDFAVADFDNDGKVDIVGTNYYSATMSVIKNNSVPGTISFAAAVTLATGGTPRGVIAQDLDGDKKPDIAVTNSADNTISIFFNTAASGVIGTSSFATRVNFTVGTTPVAIAAGDIDGDGKPELVISNNGSANISILRNTATSGSITTGSFGSAVNFTVGATPRDIAIGDLNGDGKADIAVVSQGANNVSVFPNTATSGTITTGSLGSRGDYATGSAPTALAIADIDGDGRPEIVTSDFTAFTLSILRNSKPVTVTAVSPMLAIPGATVTITGTGFNTTAANNTVYFGSTKATVTSSATTTLSVTVPVGATFNRLSVYNNATQLIGQQQYPFMPTYSSSGYNSSVLNFTAKVDVTAGSGTYNVALGDIDGDGKPDMAATNYNDNTLWLYRNISSSGSISAGSFAAPVSFAVGTNPRDVKMADLDNDGKLDIVVANYTSNTLSVFRNTASSGAFTSGTLATRVDVSTGTNPVYIGLADFDADGKIDIVNSNFGTSAMSVIKNNSTAGTLSFASAVSFGTTSAQESVYAGDLDGDGKPDIAVTNYNSNTVSVFRNTATQSSISTASFAAKVDFATGTNPWGIAAADIDGDGKPDLLVGNTSSNTISVFRNTVTSGTMTTSSFAAKVDFNSGTGPREIVAGDLNGDGKADITVVNTSANSFSAFRNTATSGAITTSSLAAKSDMTTGSVPAGIAIGDIDGDNIPDVITPNFSGTSLSVFRNNPIQVPLITAVSPNSAIPGASVTISGSGFNTTASSNIVYFGGAKAVVSGASATLLTVTVPAGASFAPVTVLNTGTGNVGYENNFFVPIFTNSYFKNDTLSFKSVTLYASTSTMSAPYSGAIGDLDGDGKPDMVVNNSGSTSPSVGILINTGNALISGNAFTLTSNITFAGSGRPNNVKLADIDGDGKLDIIAALNNVSTTSVVVLRNATTLAGSPVFVTANISIGTVSAVASITDFDGDGKSDIAVSLPAGAIGILRNTSTIGSVSFAAPTTITAGSVPSGVCFADLDGDGKPDIAATNSGYTTGVTYTGTTALVARNTSVPGSITFAAPISLTTGTGPVDIVAGDIDGDGKRELLVTNINANTFSIFRNTSAVGSLSFATKVDYASGNLTTGINIADLNGDGKLDVVESNAFTNTLYMYRNTATSGAIDASSLAGRLEFATGLTPTTVTIGDLDLDGYPDVVTGNSSSNTVSVLKNYPLPLIGNITGSNSVCAGAANITLSNSVASGYWTSTNPTKAAVGSATGVVTGYVAGIDTITYTKVAGGDTSVVIKQITINPLADSGTITGLSSVCEAAAITLSNTVVGGVWSAANSTATVTGGVVTGVAQGVDTIRYAVTNGCGTTIATKRITINPLPHAGTITGGTTVCGSAALTLASVVTGGTWSATNSNATVVAGVVTPVALGMDTIRYSYTNSCGTDVSSVVVNMIIMQWNGSSSSDWSTAANWNCGRVPTVTDDILIPVTATAPILPVGTGYTKQLTLAPGATISLAAGAVMNVKGDLTYNGSMGDGKITMNGTVLQKIKGTVSVSELELNNTAGASIDSGNKLIVAKTLYLTAGTLTTHDSLMLASDINGSGRIAQIPATGASVTGKVQVQQYIQANYRRYRFWSHPFSTAISLGQLQSYMDITGVGGSANGFTTTTTNAPSAFWLDPYTSDDTAAYDPGWKAITQINGLEASVNKLKPNQGLRLFMRGGKNEGLNGYPYMPSENKLLMIGSVNQGDQTVTLQKGTDNQRYNMVGNPYPSPVDIGTAIANAYATGDVVGAAYYVWNAGLGTWGQYVPIMIGTGPYSIQANACYQVKAGFDSAHLYFTESMKTAAPTSYLFKPSASKQNVLLHIYDTNYHQWDMLQVNFNDEATDGDDIRLDATKPSGADFNFYSLSADNKRMVIDSRPYADGKVVPLGVSSPYQQSFIVKVENIAMQEGQNIYLHDKLLAKYIPLEAGTEYQFSIGKDKATQGDSRFELSMKPKTETAAKQSFSVNVAPNPATDDVKIAFTNPDKEMVNIRIMDVAGLSVYTQKLGLQQSGSVTVPLSQLASGVYVVELTAGDKKVVQRLVKE